MLSNTEMLNVAIEEAKIGFEEGGVPIGAVLIGENETFSVGEDWLRDSGVEVTVVNNPECKDMLNSFIQKHPDIWNEDIGEVCSTC